MSKLTPTITTHRLPPSSYASTIPSLSSLLKQCVEANYCLNFLAPLPLETAADFWGSSLSSVESGEQIVFVARNEESELVGCVVLALHSHPNAPHRAEVRKLLVDERARGRGVAKGLMVALEEHARSLGRSTLILDTETGSGAETMYEKLGWVKVGVIPEISWTPDQTRCVPTTIFYKLLK